MTPTSDERRVVAARLREGSLGSALGPLTQFLTTRCGTYAKLAVSSPYLRG